MTVLVELLHVPFKVLRLLYYVSKMIGRNGSFVSFVLFVLVNSNKLSDFCNEIQW